MNYSILTGLPVLRVTPFTKINSYLGNNDDFAVAALRFKIITFLGHAEELCQEGYCVSYPLHKNSYPKELGMAMYSVSDLAFFSTSNF